MSHERKHVCPHCGADSTEWFDKILNGFGRWHHQRDGRDRCPECLNHIEWEILDRDNEILRLEREIVVGMSATGFRLDYIETPRAGTGATMIDPNKDIIAVGTTRWLRWSTLPIASRLKPGAPVSVTTGDTSIAIATGVSPDGDPQTFSVTVDPAEVKTSFGITIQGTALDGTPIASTFSIPLGPAGSTGGVPATAFDLVLLAGTPVAGGGGGTTPPPATSISASPSSISGTVGDPATALKVTDNNSTDVTASSTYTSSDPTIATVDATGSVTPVAAGTTSINVTNGSLTTSVPVTYAASSAPAAQARHA